MATGCPDDNALAALLDGTLAIGDAATLRAHLADCAECRRIAAESLQAAADLQPGAPLGRFVVESRIGAGAMGVVYAARDPELGRRVACKLLRAHAGAHADALASRMQREAQAMARLHHPNVITIYEIGEHDGQVFIAMELVEGETLRAWLATARPYDEVRRAFAAAGQGLYAAHRAGMVHRDFKPDNVLIATDGTVKVTDFGLARAVGETLADEVTTPLAHASPLHRTLTSTGAIVGTPAYMAPEQLDGKSADERADQFSFCAALWEALYGARPFAADTIEQLRRAISDGKPSADWRARGVPGRVQQALLRGLDNDPAARFPSLGELLVILEAPERSHPSWLWGAAALVPLALAGALWLRFATGPTCVDVNAKLAVGFGPARKSALATAFERSGRAFKGQTVIAVDRLLGERAERLRASYDESCRDTKRGEQSAALGDLRLACLDARVRETEALGEKIIADETGALTQGAVQAVASLAPVDDCRPALLRGRVPPPTEPGPRALVRSISNRLRDVQATAEIGRLIEARDQARALLSEATATGYRPLMAEVALALGELEDRTGDTKAAAAALQAALNAAEAGHADELAVEALTKLTRVDGYRRSQVELGLRWAEMAAAVLERIGGDERHQAALDAAAGIVLQSAGRYDEALGRLEHALALRRQVLTDRHPEIAETETQIGFVLRDQGDFEKAAKALEAALAGRRQLYGTAHPAIAETLNHLGVAYRNLGEFDKARAAHEQALAIISETLGAEHIEAGYAHNHLGNLYAYRGQWQDALASYRRALAIGQKALEPRHWELGMARSNIGMALRWIGQLDEAERELVTARDVVEPALGAAHPFVAMIHAELGDIARLRGVLPKARAELDPAVATMEQAFGKKHPQLADALIVRGWLGLAEQRLDAAEADFVRAATIYDGHRRPTFELSAAALEVGSELAHHLRAPGGPTDKLDVHIASFTARVPAVEAKIVKNLYKTRKSP